jgi:hypothetical protein
MEPKDQGQHRVSETYLKQFGFRDKNNSWKISVYEQGNPITQIRSIKSFTKESNIFDISFLDLNHPARRLFEKNCQKIETFYPRLIKTLNEKSHLIPEAKDLLINFVPSLICRNIHFRKFIGLLLQSSTRDKFIDEISIFQTKDEHIEFLKSIPKKLEINDQINLLIGHVMNHLINVFKSFNFIVFRDFDNRLWLTTDNPVIIDNKNRNEYLIALEAEIYFPISKNYFLFMYHPKIKFVNPLRDFLDCSLNQADEHIHDTLTNVIENHVFKYLIFPYYQERFDLSVNKNE